MNDTKAVQEIYEFLYDEGYWDNDRDAKRGKQSLSDAIKRVGYDNANKLAAEVVARPGFSENEEDIEEWLKDAISFISESSENVAIRLTYDSMIHPDSLSKYEKNAKKFNVNFEAKMRYDNEPETVPALQYTISGTKDEVVKLLTNKSMPWGFNKKEALETIEQNTINESDKNGVYARLNELLLNESEVTIKHFSVNESAIVLPNGNITYTIDGGRTWQINEAAASDDATLDAIKMSLPNLVKEVQSKLGLSPEFKVSIDNKGRYSIVADVTGNAGTIDALVETCVVSFSEGSLNSHGNKIEFYPVIKTIIDGKIVYFDAGMSSLTFDLDSKQFKLNVSRGKSMFK